jgi:hypothetical protein
VHVTTPTKSTMTPCAFVILLLQLKCGCKPEFIWFQIHGDARRSYTMATKIPLLKEGCLYKRQRGKSANNDLRRLKFQQRHIRLDEKTLGYYEDRKVILLFNDTYMAAAGIDLHRT